MILHRSRIMLMVCTSISFASVVSLANAQNAQQQTQKPENATQRSEGATELQRIVVKGQGRVPASVISDTPLASQTAATQLREKEIGNLRDLGNSTEPGVEYVESRAGAGGGTFIRGMGGARITSLVDDIPIPFLETQIRVGSNSPAVTISDSTDSVDFTSLSSVDVVRGADASRIGSGAMAGALVFKTLVVEDVIQEDRDWGGVAKIGYDSRNKSYNGSVAAAKKIDNTSILFQTGYVRGHETRNKGKDDIFGVNRTVKNPADMSQNNLLFKLRQDLEGGHQIGLTGERFFSQTDTDMKSLQDGKSYKPGLYNGVDDTTRERLSVDYRYSADTEDSLIDAANLTFYWQQIEKHAGAFATRFSPAFPNGWQFDRFLTTGEKSIGATGGLVSQFDTASVGHTIRLGGNINTFRYSEYTTSVGGTSAPNANDSQADVPSIDGVRAGFYLEDELSFTDTGFSLTPGVRLDWYKYTPKNSADFARNTGASFGLPKASDDFRLSPKVLAKYDLNENLNVFGQWSMTYRAPTVTDLYSNFSNFAHGYARLGNANLKAETGQGFEIGAEYSDDSWSGKVTAYHNRYSNFIDVEEYVGVPFPNGRSGLLFTLVNRDKVTISGIEFKLRKDFDNGFFAHGSLAYASGKNEDTDKYLRTLAPLKSIIGVGYAQEQWGAEFTGIFSAGARDTEPYSVVSSGRPTFYNLFDAPGYGIFNLSGWWEPEQAKGLRIQAGIYNLFDKTYFNAVSNRNVNTLPASIASTNQPVDYYSEPGRTFKISLTQKF